MVKKCAWGLCNSDSRYPERLEGGIVFIPFPKPRRSRDKCMRWIKACGRPHHQLNVNKADYNNHLYVCSKHFVNGKQSDEHPDPLPVSSSSASKHQTPNRPSPKQRSTTEPSRKRAKKTLEVESSTSSQDTTSVLPLPQPSSHSAEHSLPAHSSLHDHSTSLHLLAATAESHRLQHELQEMKKLLATETLKNVELRRRLKDNPSSKDILMTPEARPDYFTAEAAENSPVRGNFKYHTGFSYQDFLNIFYFVAPLEFTLPFNLSKNNTCAKKIAVKDQFFMVLVKLRVNFDFKHLAYLFKISPQDSGFLFKEWINYLFHLFGSIPIWPHRDVFVEQMPDRYKQDFPNTFAILDGTEIKVNKPSSLRTQSQCYSDYKSATTLKGLVSVDPRGSFNFISMLFSGSMSDKEITIQSGLLQQLRGLLACGKLKPGDGIMVDKGFHISNEIEELGLKLWIPPFAISGKQMQPSEVAKTKNIARRRVIVENAIGRAKKFRIIAQKVEMNLFSSINQIFFVCCFLTNFMTPLSKK